MGTGKPHVFRHTFKRTELPSGVMAVALDSSGNIDVGGTYGNSVDFDPGRGITTLPTMGGGFIVQLNSSGGLNWARALESGDSSAVIPTRGSQTAGVSLDPGSTGRIGSTIPKWQNSRRRWQEVELWVVYGEEVSREGAHRQSPESTKAAQLLGRSRFDCGACWSGSARSSPRVRPSFSIHNWASQSACALPIFLSHRFS